VDLESALWALTRALHARIQRAERKGDELAERLLARRQVVLGILHLRRERLKEEEARAKRPRHDERRLYDGY
jgi:hypothetical protein